MSGNTTFDENKNQEEVIIIVISAIATVFLIAILSSVAVYLVRKTHRRSNTGWNYILILKGVTLFYLIAMLNVVKEKTLFIVYFT